MLGARTRRVIRISAIAAAVLAGLGLAGLLVAWSGIYSVAASRGHGAIAEWLLAFGMRNSVKTHAWPIEPPPLNDPNLAKLGAGHFHSSCTYCHGAPGMAINLVASQALPPPPALAEAVREWAPQDLFWIVKHGIKYTGMPGWVAQERDDEVWAVVAFLQKLPELTPPQYRELALGGAALEEKSGAELARAGYNPHATGGCARCHGAEGRGPASNLVPILHGQKSQYLAQALTGYAEGNRRSGIMQPVAWDLDAASITRLADYYAGLAWPQARAAPEQRPQSIEAGRVIATSGAPNDRIPACNACHGASGSPTFPRLDGQHAAYLARQLQLWKEGVNAATATGAIMAPIAQRLSHEQIQAVSAYYASVSPASKGKPAP